MPTRVHVTLGDINNFYVNNPMKKYRYMKIPLKYIPKEIMDEYNIQAHE